MLEPLASPSVFPVANHHWQGATQPCRKASKTLKTPRVCFTHTAATSHALALQPISLHCTDAPSASETLPAGGRTRFHVPRDVALWCRAPASATAAEGHCRLISCATCAGARSRAPPCTPRNALPSWLACRANEVINTWTWLDWLSFFLPCVGWLRTYPWSRWLLVSMSLLLKEGTTIQPTPYLHR